MSDEKGGEIMKETQALRQAIFHYESVISDHKRQGRKDKCYAVPILEGLKRFESRLEKAEEQVNRFDAWVKSIQRG